MGSAISRHAPLGACAALSLSGAREKAGDAHGLSDMIEAGGAITLGCAMTASKKSQPAFSA